MFGAVVTYLYEYILGIRQDADSYGYDRITISPFYVDGLDRVAGSITTVKGKIAVSYEKKDGKARLTVEIPDGISATVVAPAGEKVLLDKASISTFE